MARPRVSIGLPVYNGERYLGEAIESLLAQEHGDFELLISDNASTDATEEICRDYATRDRRIEYERLPANVGAARNYNHVFERARGEFFRWAAADDRCAPDHLRRCLDEFRRAPDTALVYPRTAIIGADGEFVEEYDDGLDLRANAPHGRLEKLLTNLQLCNAVFGLIRRDVLASTRLIGGYVSSDQTLLVELALRGHFHEIDGALFHRRLHVGGSQFAHDSTEDLAAWFAPENRGRRPAPRTRLFSEMQAAIWRAPLTPSERLRCSWVFQRCWLPKNWRVIGGEFKRRLRDLAKKRNAS